MPTESCHYFTDVAVAFTLTSLILGTNLLYYCTKDYGMTHAYCFALFSMLLYGIKKFLLTNRAYWILIISLLLGLLTAMRITHIVWMILPFLVDIGSLQSFFIRIKFIFSQYWRIALLFTANSTNSVLLPNNRANLGEHLL